MKNQRIEEKQAEWGTIIGVNMGIKKQFDKVTCDRLEVH